MQNSVSDSLQSHNIFILLTNMEEYLRNVEQVYQTLELDFQSEEQRADSLDELVQVMQGLDYCKKMFCSVVPPLRLDVTENFGDAGSLNTFVCELQELFEQIDIAAENGDYSLLADFAEYDLMSLVQKAQKLIVAVRDKCNQRKGLELVNVR